MDINFKREQNTLIAQVDGEIDHHVACEINKRIDAELLVNGTKNLVFDMSKVHFMDSSGIAVVVGRYKKVNTLGGKCIVSSLNKQVRKILEMTNMAQFIEFADSVEAALELLE